MTVAGALLLGSLSLRVADRWYYRDPAAVLALLGLAPADGCRADCHRPLDPLFTTFPFVWAWSDIALATLIATRLHHPAGYLLTIVFVGTRFRVLQEASHTAVHRGLCRSRQWQWAVSNVAAQWPCFRPDMHHRFIAHVREHHAHANELGADPNITRFISIGVVPGISPALFKRRLLYPLTPSGLRDTLEVSVANTFRRNRTTAGLALRLAVVAVVAGLFWRLGDVAGLAAGYVVPMLTIYPLCSWISALAEHRWFALCEETDRRARECVNGRPTDYTGLGRLAKHTIFPFSDHYHLAHSLYPKLRWNYLASVDRALKEQDARYALYASEGLLRPHRTRPSALSELSERLTTAAHPDVAGWAVGLCGPDAGGASRPTQRTVLTG